METHQPILDPEQRRNVMHHLKPYMRRAQDIYAHNSSQQVDEIIKRYGGWLCGQGVTEEKVRSMTLIDLLIETDKFDRSDQIIGDHDA